MFASHLVFSFLCFYFKEDLEWLNRTRISGGIRSFSDISPEMSPKCCLNHLHSITHVTEYAFISEVVVTLAFLSIQIFLFSQN